MLEPQDCRFWRVALQTGLIDENRLRACWDEIPVEKRTPDAIDRRLARRIVEIGAMTRWQAQQLLAGVKAQGLRYNKYVIEDLLGLGGMGRVYLAHDRQLDRRVALKLLSRERMNNPRALARFRREARVGAQLQHDNLVRIYDAGEEGGQLFLVMEYIEGKTLGKILVERGPLPASVAARITRQVALGLEHANIKKLVHRDVNPMNILLDRHGTAKLTDLGLAIDLGDDGVAVTRDGATVGTFDYISPEQARHSRSIDIRSDIYSLGCSFYQMLTGRVPFPQPSLPEKLYQHQMVDPEPMDNLVAGVPPEIQAIILRMMAKNPDDRYATPLDVARALEPFECGPVVLEEIESSPEVPVLINTVELANGHPDNLESDKKTELLGDARGDELLPELCVEPLAAGNAFDSETAPLFPQIDIGPEPSLMENRSGTRRVVESPRTATSRRPRWVSRLSVAVSLILMAAIAWMIVQRVWDSTTETAPSQGQGGKSADRTGTPVDEGFPIAVRYLDDGAVIEVGDLKEAVRQAVDKNAEVLLNGPEAMVLGPDISLEINGRLVIAASANLSPVLTIQRGRSDIPIRVRPSGSLILRGITLHLETDAEGNLPPALIDSLGALTLEKCEFVAVGPDRSTAAIRSTGRELSIVDSHLNGFDTPIVVKAIGGCQVMLDNCLLTREQTAETPPERGWAVRMTNEPIGGSSSRRLSFDHCTVIGLGLVAVADFGNGASLEIQTSGTIVQNPALMMWAGPEDFPRGLTWRGDGNLYAVSTKGPWVIPATGDGPSSDSELPSGLDSWKRVLGASETGSDARSARFVGSPGVSAEARRPSDFVIVGGPSTDLGIDAREVGL